MTQIDEQVGWPYQREGVFIQRRRAAPPSVPQTDEDVPDSYYQTRPPTSSRRYVDTRGNQVIQQGNRKVVIHKESHRRHGVFIWMIFFGLLMFIMVTGFILLTAAGYWWQGKQDDWKYGVPRTYQTDAFVGHGDTLAHPDHFVAINVGGIIQVVELNPLNPKLDHIYSITTAENSLTPVTLAFEDTNHDGKPDLLVIIGDSNPYTVTMLNNGTEFTH
jgi:hypothetical protein